MAPCGAGQCGPRLRAARLHREGRGRSGGREDRDAAETAGTQAPRTRGRPWGAGRPSHPGASRVPGPRSGPAGRGLTACSGGAQPAHLARPSAAEPSSSSPTPRLSSWGHSLERGDPAESAHWLRLEAPQGCGAAEPDLASLPWAHHWACRGAGQTSGPTCRAGCLAGPAGPSPE